MKAQCERCKEIVTLAFEVAEGGGGIRVRCGECKAEYFVPAVAAASEPGASGEVGCPKCGEGHGQGAEACKRCGLVFANWKPELANAGMSLGDVKEATDLWEACAGEWGDGARHEAFIEHCRKAGVLAFAAARYRESSTREGAADRLKQIRILAEHSLATVPRAAQPKRRTTLFAALFLVVSLLIGGYVLLQSTVP